MTRARILIVEDEAIVAHDIQTSLLEMGYDAPAIVESGIEAVAAASAMKPDLILMDVVLRGDMDGIEAANLIKERTSSPIVFLTAHADSGTLERAQFADPFGYLVKPIDQKQLFTNIEMALYKSKVDKRLRESRTWLDGTLQSIRDAVIALDTERRVIFMNHAAETLFGRVEQEARGTFIEDAFSVHPHPISDFADNPFETTRKGLSRSVAEERLFGVHGLDGRLRTLSADAAPILDSAGTRLGTVCVFRDVTARKHADDRLRLLSAAIEQSTEGIALVDMSGHILFVNRAFAASHGFEPADVLGAHLGAFHNEAQLPIVKEILEKIIQEGQWSGEVWHCRKDGRVFPTIMHNTLFRDSSGIPIGLMGTLRDITELKAAEEELLRSHRRLEEYSLSLEEKVTKRTSDLALSQDSLRKYSESLEKTNEALHVVIGAVEKEKTEIDKRIAYNINLTIKPVLEQLKSEELSDSARFLLKSLEFNLSKLVSPFGQSLATVSPRLTPRETRICEMIRSGLSSKQMARVMSISPQTVLAHRRNIRNKLGLKKSRQNLASFLRQDAGSL